MSAPSMSMNTVIHSAVRRDLARLRAALDRLAEGDAGRAAELDRAFRHLADQLTHHHEGEHEIAWPALRSLGFDSDLIARLDEEHEAMSAALTECRSAMTAVAASTDRARIAAAVAAAERLEAVTTAHLDHEEAEVEPLFLARHDDPALAEMSKRFRGQLSLRDSGALLAWLQDGAGQRERTALRQLIPPPVVALVGGLLGRRYRREIAPVWAEQVARS